MRRPGEPIAVDPGRAVMRDLADGIAHLPPHEQVRTRAMQTALCSLTGFAGVIVVIDPATNDATVIDFGPTPAPAPLDQQIALTQRALYTLAQFSAALEQAQREAQALQAQTKTEA